MTADSQTWLNIEYQNESHWDVVLSAECTTDATNWIHDDSQFIFENCFITLILLVLHCNLLLNRWPLSFGGGGPMIHLMFLNSSKSVIRFIMFGLVCFCHSPLQFSVITFHFISLSLSLHRLKKTPCVYVCGYMHACSSVCSWIAAISNMVFTNQIQCQL